MKRWKARNSHDTLQCAINGWAAFCLHDYALNSPDNAHHQSKIKLYNLLSELFLGSIKKIELKN